MPPLRLVVGLGDQDREQQLLPPLQDAGTVTVVVRCLSADQLLQCVGNQVVDAALVAASLHRLADDLLTELLRSDLPLVVLVAPADAPAWRDTRATILPLDASPDVVRAALLATAQGAGRGTRSPTRDAPSAQGQHTQAGSTDAGRSAPRMKGARDAHEPSVTSETPAIATGEPSTGIAVVAIWSGPGSPGRTTLAVNMAAALGLVMPTVLVDADLDAPSVTAALDLDPTRNIGMLAHGDPQMAREWEHAISQEVQPLTPQSPQSVVLGGLSRPAMRDALTRRFSDRLVVELQRRYRFVILDIGTRLDGTDGAFHRVLLEAAGQILLVVAADLVGLWRGRVALDQLALLPQISRCRVALVLNGYDRRYHHDVAAVSRALGVPVAAVIPHDDRGVQRALAEQRPVIFDRRSKAGQAVLDLAGRMHGGSIALPVTEPRTTGWGLLDRIIATRSTPTRRVPDEPVSRPSRGEGRGEHDARRVTAIR